MNTLVTLKQAFMERRLAALHIDLQHLFHDKNTRAVFPAVAEFAAGMRRLGVPNYWAAYTRGWEVTLHEDFARAHRGRDTAIHKSVKAHATELVFGKKEMSVFDTPHLPLETYLRDQGIDTLLLTGIYAQSCVAMSARDAIKSGFRVVAAIDATDCSFWNAAQWRDDVLATAEKTADGDRLAVASSGQIIEALRSRPR